MDPKIKHPLLLGIDSYWHAMCYKLIMHSYEIKKMFHKISILLPTATLFVIALAQVACSPELVEIQEQFAKSNSSALSTLSIDLYEQIKEEQNARISRLSSIFCRAEYICRWKEDGKEHLELGEGSFFIKPPDRVAACYGKLGDTSVWMAHCVDRSWLIIKDDEKPYACLVKDGFIQSVGLSENQMYVMPEELLFASGMFTLPQAELSRWSLSGGFYGDTITIVLLNDDVERRIHFSEDTLLPLRLEYYNSKENQLLSHVSLTQYEELNKSEIQSENPMYPTRIVISRVEPPFELEITVDIANNIAEGSEKAFKNVFDFDTMLRSMGISSDVVVEYGFDDE